MSTYYSRYGSYSRSANAEDAEDDGRLPLTRFCKTYGLYPDLVRAKGTGEWHHVGKYAQAVDYYDWRPFARRWHIYSRPHPNATQLGNRIQADARLKEEWRSARDAARDRLIWEDHVKTLPVRQFQSANWRAQRMARELPVASLKSDLWLYEVPAEEIEAHYAAETDALGKRIIKAERSVQIARVMAVQNLDRRLALANEPQNKDILADVIARTTKAERSSRIARVMAVQNLDRRLALANEPSNKDIRQEIVSRTTAAENRLRQRQRNAMNKELYTFRPLTVRAMSLDQVRREIELIEALKKYPSSYFRYEALVERMHRLAVVSEEENWSSMMAVSA